jgi:hypothetical protein
VRTRAATLSRVLDILPAGIPNPNFPAVPVSVLPSDTPASCEFTMGCTRRVLALIASNSGLSLVPSSRPACGVLTIDTLGAGCDPFAATETGAGQTRVLPVPFRIGITYCQQGGTGSSDRFCPPIQAGLMAFDLTLLQTAGRHTGTGAPPSVITANVFSNAVKDFAVEVEPSFG